MGYVDFSTYYPAGLNYGGVHGQPLRFASVLRDNLRGKAIDSPEAEGYIALIERHDAVPIRYGGRVIPSWAVLDFYKLIELNPANREQILRTDRQAEAKGLEEEIRAYRNERTPGYRKGLETAEERYALLLRNSISAGEIPPLQHVLGIVNEGKRRLLERVVGCPITSEAQCPARRLVA